LAGGVALGGVMTAMLLGHWYLNTPTASGRPLEFVTSLLVGALIAELAFSLLMGPSTARPNPAAQRLPPGTTIQTTGGGVKISTPTATPSKPGKGPEQPQPQQARQTPLDTTAMVWLEYLMGLIAPGILAAVALYLTRERSFQSATECST